MKNKLKKSKIIVPALALITATTVASVTGTVAWFTASRTATVEASEFESTAQSSNLKVKTEALVGTKDATTTAASSATIVVDGLLTHGSYAAAANNTGSLFVAEFGGDDEAVTGYKSLGNLEEAKKNASGQTTENHSTWAADVNSTSGNTWYAVAWSMTFTIDGASNLSTSSCLFFNPTATTFTDSITNGDTIQGLRIALMTSTKVSVVGGLDSGEKHVKDEWTDGSSSSAENHTESFSSTIYHKYGASVTKAVDAEKNTLTNHPCCLGDIDKTNGLTVTAVAWFEGEDNSIVKDKTMSKVKASLSFYSRNVKASA